MAHPYIAPMARVIDLESEDVLLSSSVEVKVVEEKSVRRVTIWDDMDE